MDIFKIKEKADLLYWIKSLTDKVCRTPDKDEVWRQELESIKQMIRNRHGPKWVRVLVCKVLMNNGIKESIVSRDTIKLKEKIKQIQYR